MAKGPLAWTQRSARQPAGGSVAALGRDQLHVVFQPIVDVVSGTTFAHEALVRCKDPRFPSPPALFEAAVAESACGRLGRSIRDVAFTTCGEHALFVNLHPQELSSRWLVMTDDPLGFHDHGVFLEVTESAAFEHYDLCMSVLKELCRRTGASLVVDDFGAGYSNLERVADLEPAIVKLDLALTRDIQKRKARQVVVRHVVAMCTELGARVVAEGVETVDELLCMRDLGVSFAQGYLLARPAAPPPVPTWPLAAPRRQPPPVPPRRKSALTPRSSDRPRPSTRPTKPPKT